MSAMFDDVTMCPIILTSSGVILNIPPLVPHWGFEFAYTSEG